MNTQANESKDFQSSSGYEPPQENSMRETKQNLTEKSKQAAASVKQTARETKDRVMQQGSEAVHKLQDQAGAFAQERKTQLGERVHGYSSAVRRAADKLREEDDPNIAHYAETVADRLDQAADYVQASDIGTLLRDVETAARRRPEIFFGGMFIVGLALSRFLKASNQRDDIDADEEEYWVEDSTHEDEPMPMGETMTDDLMPDYAMANPGSGGMQENKPAWPTSPAPGGNL